MARQFIGPGEPPFATVPTASVRLLSCDDNMRMMVMVIIIIMIIIMIMMIMMVVMMTTVVHLHQYGFSSTAK